MRRTRRLTSGEKWELGLFLSFLLVTFLCLTAVLNLPGIPKLFAAAFRANDQASNGTHSVGNGTALAQNGTVSERNGGVLAPEITVPALPAIAVPAPLMVLPAPADNVPDAPAVSFHKKPAVETRIYNGQKYRYVKTLRLKVTAYSPDSKCCWPYPGTTTASGMSVKTNHGKLVAADTHLIPMHALVAVPGYAGGGAVPVLDRGGAIKGYRMDVLMPRFDQAKEWGSRLLEVKIYMPVDE